MGNNKVKAKQEPPKVQAPPAKPPPPAPKAEPTKTPSSMAAPDAHGALRDFKENVLGFSEDGGGCARKTPDERFQAFVGGPIFSIISSFVILANTVFIGIETQISIGNQIKRLQDMGQESTHPAGEYFFTCFFVLELFMRIVAQKKNFVLGPDKYWNFFDTFLILISLFEMVADAAVNLSVFRIFRIFRVVRLLKVIKKVQLLESLNLMVFGIINCIAPLVWAILILFLIMYAFGVYFMSGLSSVLEEMELTDADFSMDVVEGLDLQFGSVYRSIMSLFEAVTGGNDWAGIAEHMRGVSEFYYCCFALYVVFITLGVLNIVTGFFVDGTMQANVNAREEMLKQAQEKKNTMIQLVGELFTQLDTDQSGKLSYEELDSHLHDEALQEFFCLLDIKGEGEVSITDFTNGCLKIMGAPKNLDICT